MVNNKTSRVILESYYTALKHFDIVTSKEQGLYISNLQLVQITNFVANDIFGTTNITYFQLQDKEIASTTFLSDDNDLCETIKRSIRRLMLNRAIYYPPIRRIIITFLFDDINNRN